MNQLSEEIIEIFTDGSCHTELKTGGWAAMLLIGEEKVVLEGIESDTTHNRMELLAVLEAGDYIKSRNIRFNKINIYSDSQYVVNITERRIKLKQNYFLTNKGTPIQNSDLVQRLVELIDNYNINFIKVVAHQKKTESINYNREVDKRVRKLVRDAVKNR